jgi:hypothetical protein
MINSKVTKGTPKESTEDRLFKLLESIDWKLWEMYNIMKDNVPEKEATKSTTTKAKKPTNE